jgi:hypothetical protein
MAFRYCYLLFFLQRKRISKARPKCGSYFSVFDVDTYIMVLFLCNAQRINGTLDTNDGALCVVLFGMFGGNEEDKVLYDLQGGFLISRPLWFVQKLCALEWEARILYVLCVVPC